MVLLCLLWVFGMDASRAGARAQSQPYRLKNTDALFLSLEFVGSAGLVAGGGLLLNAVDDSEPECGWCETNGFDRAMRRLLLMDDSRAAAVASDIFLGGVVPVTAASGVIVPALVEKEGWFALQDSVIILNAALITELLTQITKTVSDRRRPAFHYNRQEKTRFRDPKRSEFRSFFSGHASISCSIASSASTLAFLRGYGVAPYVAIGTGVFALTTGILRIAADVHWATDVIAGAVVGTLVGFLVPFLLHPRERQDRGSEAVDPEAIATSQPFETLGQANVMFAWSL